jgi:hypothetical protein
MQRIIDLPQRVDTPDEALAERVVRHAVELRQRLRGRQLAAVDRRKVRPHGAAQLPADARIIGVEQGHGGDVDELNRAEEARERRQVTAARTRSHTA